MIKKPTFHLSFLSGNGGFLLIAILLGLSAIFTRYSTLDMPLLDFHPTRQLFGAIKARGMYYRSAPDVPEWKKEIVRKLVSDEPIIEPPLMESASAWLYERYGENTAFPRALASSFWLIGAIFLFFLAKNLTGSRWAGIIAAGFYILLPYAISASRAFQPDPLMICLMIAFWWAFENWSRHFTWKWAVIAGLAGGLAIFVKFTAVFFIIFPAIGFLFAANKLLPAIRNTQTWLLAILGVLPAGVYFYYGTYIDPFLTEQFNGRFFIDKWVDPFFYLHWAMTVENVIPIVVMLFGLIGVLLAPASSKKIYGSMLVAYVLFGFTFAHHISSHDYYSEPLIPIVALFLAQASASTNFKPAVEDQPTLVGGIVLITSVFIALFTVLQVVDQKNDGAYKDVAKWVEIGEAVGHQPGLMALTTDYGYPLEYYGFQTSSLWPSSAEIGRVKKEFPRENANKSFFLITDFEELAFQQDLLHYLVKNHPILAQKNTYILFDLLHKNIIP